MRVLLGINPRSGRGKAAAGANRLGSLLASHVVHRVELPRVGAESPDWLSSRLRDVDACIVIGGDGTMHGALPSLIECGTPAFHFATGTENLFSREFGMHRTDLNEAAALVAASLEANRTAWFDAARCVGPCTPASGTFGIMLSAGPDAGVIDRLQRVRTGTISHLSYVRHIMAEWQHPHLPRVDLRVDGVEVSRDEPGMLLVANTRQYALRIDPAREARPDDGLLDAVFLPATSAWAVASWLVGCRCRTQRSMHAARRLRGSVVEARLRFDAATPAIQVDGDLMPLLPSAVAGATASGEVSLEIRALPKAVRLLLPPDGPYAGGLHHGPTHP